MSDMKKVSSEVLGKIRKLAQITDELYQGKNFNITRLTTLKTLCKETHIAAFFVFYIAQRTLQRMEEKEPEYIKPEKWLQYKEMVKKAILKMENYLEDKTKEGEQSLRDLLYEIKELQNEHKNQRWGPVRIIESSDALVVENALKCILSPEASAFWGYHVGREYAEKYNPRYGTGLIPESAPSMEDIVSFWFQYYGIS